jgi:hypothetical protein
LIFSSINIHHFLDQRLILFTFIIKDVLYGCIIGSDHLIFMPTLMFYLFLVEGMMLALTM